MFPLPSCILFSFSFPDSICPSLPQPSSSNNWTLTCLHVCQSGSEHCCECQAPGNIALLFANVRKVTKHDNENVTKLSSPPPPVFQRLSNMPCPKVMKRSCARPWWKAEWFQGMHHQTCWGWTRMANGFIALQPQAECLNLSQVWCDFPLRHLSSFTLIICLHQYVLSHHERITESQSKAALVLICNKYPGKWQVTV